MKIKVSVERCFFAIEQHVIFTSRPLLPAIKKDMLSASLLSNVVYNFLCHCDSQYIGCTSQQLQDKNLWAFEHILFISHVLQCYQPFSGKNYLISKHL